MPQLDLADALREVRALILSEGFHKAVASGKRHASQPQWQRADVRPVVVAGESLLQFVTTATQAHSGPVTKNFPAAAASEALDELLSEPFAHWRVVTTSTEFSFRVTKKGMALAQRAAGPGTAPRLEHDRQKQRIGADLFSQEDSQQVAWQELAGTAGGNADKRRQVEAFLRILEAASTGLRTELDGVRPLRMVDLGCGNAYLTFAAHGWMSQHLPTLTLGVDSRSSAMERNTDLAQRLGVAPHTGELGIEGVRFAAQTIAQATAALQPGEAPDIVLALHACDTATDEALAQAVAWKAPLILAAPCCHHDISAQLKERWSGAAGGVFAAVGQDGILRERFADTLTDTIRAAYLRLQGYRVDVIEFIASQHTPRNTLIRAVYTGAKPAARRETEYQEIVSSLQLRPALVDLLDQARMVVSESEA